MKKQWLSICWCGFLFLYLASTAPLFSQTLPSNMHLAKVELQGSKLLTVQEVILLSGLTIGEPISMADLERVTNKLSQYGYFSQVSFSYKYLGANLTLSFNVVDTDKFAECIFDNFVLMKDAEIIAAIKQALPSFANQAPEMGTANQFIAKLLETQLKKRGEAQTVDSFLVAGKGVKSRMVFRIRDLDLPICQVRFEGASQDAEPYLHKATAALEKEPYSKLKIDTSIQLTLTPLYQRLGHWGFEVLDASPAPTKESAGCAQGIPLVLRLKEGDKYNWGSALWAGNRKKNGAELDVILGMKADEIANLDKIQTGLARVSKTYWNSGFIDVSLDSSPKLDNQNRRLNYYVKIEEGDQYHMGEFRCGDKNQPGPCRSLAETWRLKPGDVFDGAYFDEFEKSQFSDWAKKYSTNQMPLLLVWRADRQNKIVHVLVTVANKTP